MESDHSNIRAVEISLGIIHQLVELDGARVTELAEELNIAPSTAHNHLQTLLNNGFVVDEGSLYYPSLEFLHVGEYARQRKIGYRKAEQHVKALAEESGGRTHFTVLEHGRGRYVYTKTGDLAVETFSRYGSQFPLHVTAAGKSMLAELPDWRVEEIVDQHGLDASTDQSLTDKEELFAELETTRECGVAFNLEEHNEGISAVAAAVQEPNGGLLGALSISGPAQRFKGKLIHEEFPDLLLARVNEFELDILYSD